MATAAIVGAGVMGTAVAWPLSDNGHQVRLVGTHLDKEIIASCKEKNFHPRLKRDLPRNVAPYYLEEIGQALEGVDFIVSGVNSLGARWIGRTLAPYVKPGAKIIGVTKGLEAGADGELVILPEVLRSELPAEVRGQVRLAAIGGPCIAGELAGRRQSCVYFGSRDWNWPNGWRAFSAPITITCSPLPRSPRWSWPWRSRTRTRWGSGWPPGC